MVTKLIVLIIILGLCLYAVFLYTRPIPISTIRNPEQIRVTTSPQAESLLRLSPQRLTVNDFLEHELIITLMTGSNELTAVQLELKYDPEKITVTAIRPGELFGDAISPISNPIQRRGRVEFALVLPEHAPPVNGKGSIAVLSFRRNQTATESATTAIDFLPKTSVREQGATTSLLKKTEHATIELGALSAPTPIYTP